MKYTIYLAVMFAISHTCCPIDMDEIAAEKNAWRGKAEVECQLLSPKPDNIYVGDKVILTAKVKNVSNEKYLMFDSNKYWEIEINTRDLPYTDNRHWHNAAGPLAIEPLNYELPDAREILPNEYTKENKFEIELLTPGNVEFVIRYRLDTNRIETSRKKYTKIENMWVGRISKSINIVVKQDMSVKMAERYNAAEMYVLDEKIELYSRIKRISEIKAEGNVFSARWLSSIYRKSVEPDIRLSALRSMSKLLSIGIAYEQIQCLMDVLRDETCPAEVRVDILGAVEKMHISPQDIGMYIGNQGYVTLNEDTKTKIRESVVSASKSSNPLVANRAEKILERYR